MSDDATGPPLRVQYASTTQPAERRALAGATLVDSAGDGLFLAGSALFLTRGLGLSVGQAGLGLTLAGVVSLLVSTDVGRAADRLGPRRVFVALMSMQMVSVACYPLVRGLWSLVLVATVAGVCRQGAQAARGGLIGQVAGRHAPELRSFLHAVANVGLAIGAAAAGLAVARDTHPAYLTLMWCDAASFGAAALLALRLPGNAPGVSTAGRRTSRRALRDRPFITLTALSVALSLQYVVSGYLLPLWVAFHTEAPRWFASPLLLVNTALIVLFQVRTSRAFSTIAEAGTALRLTGPTLAVGCMAFAAASLVSNPLACIGVLMVAIVVHSGAELLTVAASSVLSFQLAPRGAVGEYQGVWNLGFGTSVALGPGLLTYACLQHGKTGWLVLGIVFAVVALVMGTIATTLADPVEPSHRRVPARAATPVARRTSEACSKGIQP